MKSKYIVFACLFLINIQVEALELSQKDLSDFVHVCIQECVSNQQASPLNQRLKISADEISDYCSCSCGTVIEGLALQDLVDFNNAQPAITAHLQVALINAGQACLNDIKPQTTETGSVDISPVSEFFEIREAFPEYTNLGDLEFACRFSGIISEIGLGLDTTGDQSLTNFVRRIPKFKEIPRKQLIDNLNSTFSTAIQHFSLSPSSSDQCTAILESSQNIIEIRPIKDKQESSCDHLSPAAKFLLGCVDQ